MQLNFTVNLNVDFLFCRGFIKLNWNDLQMEK